jgi:hypothetical protein
MFKMEQTKYSVGYSEFDIQTGKCIWQGPAWQPPSIKAVLTHCKFLNKSFPTRLFIPWEEQSISVSEKPAT